MRASNLCAALVTLLFASVSAQDSLTCLDKASLMIKPESKMTLVTRQGQQITGHLLAIDQAASQVTIHKLDEASRMSWARLSSASWGSASVDTATLDGSNIAEIKYFDYGRLKPEPIIGGTLFFALVFGAIAAGLEGIDIGIGLGTGDKDREGAFVKGALIGGAVGLALGTAISLATPTARKIKCE
jgi:hypothetical protein